jgi:broad specificity phosphatase PhoE
MNMAPDGGDKAADFELTVKTSEQLKEFKLGSYFGMQIREIDRRPEATAQFRQHQRDPGAVEMSGLSFRVRYANFW